MKKMNYLFALINRMSCAGLVLFIIITNSSLFAEDYLYYKNFVHHSNGESCEHRPPVATFTAYLNNDQSKILIESAPRWNDDGDPNIPGSGVFGLELGNFSDPVVNIGDTVFIRFTCNADEGGQGTLLAEVSNIPWYYFPRTLYLVPAGLPAPPQNVSLTLDNQHRRIITWSQEQDVSYSVYRQVIQDTTSNGLSRRLYYRIAEDITTDTFIDTSTTDTVLYGYTVFATSNNGVVSSHSKEVVEGTVIPEFTVVPRATTALLRWGTYQPPVGTLNGYNIYRRSANGSFEAPIAFEGMDTVYIDSRLKPGTTYYYKIAARMNDQSELGESEETEISTLASQDGLYTYANLKLAVVIYKNTNRGGISDTEVEKIKTMLNVGKLFYWRNSGMKLNVGFTYYVIDNYKDFGDPNDSWRSMLKTAHDLDDLGVMNAQYDIVFRITPAVNGYWSYGVQYLNLPGPQRKTGFSHSYWPPGTGVVYPGHLPNIDYNLTWIFIHEVQHAIDALYDANGHPEMFHGDQPWMFPVACGEHLDFQAKMFRTFAAYEDLLNDWGDIYEASDTDNDGFPDCEPLLALDEARFGSSAINNDTDNDGYTDRQEALDGIYEGSDPNNPDTDNDGIIDSLDQYVRFPVNTTISRFTPVIDGNIEDGWPLVNEGVNYSTIDYSPVLYLCYDNDYLYMAFKLENFSVPEIFFDFHTDGWFHSSGNTTVKINPATGDFLSFRSWDASPAVQTYCESIGRTPDGMWDDDSKYQEYFNRRVIAPEDVICEAASDYSVIQIEMAIPKSDYAGLTLQPGDSFGLNVNYTRINSDPDLWAAIFDQYNFIHFRLDSAGVSIDGDNNRNLAMKFNLSQNYPNPFNSRTKIDYQIDNEGFPELTIYNILGERVRTLVNSYTQPGVYQVVWDGKNAKGIPAPNGIYFYKLSMPGKIALIRKMVLLK
jgi:hypothetical protein